MRSELGPPSSHSQRGRKQMRTVSLVVVACMVVAFLLGSGISFGQAQQTNVPTIINYNFNSNPGTGEPYVSRLNPAPSSANPGPLRLHAGEQMMVQIYNASDNDLSIAFEDVTLFQGP